MRSYFCLLLLAVGPSLAEAGLSYQYSPNGAQFELPATFTFGFTRAGMETSLDVVVPDDVAYANLATFEAHITKDNAIDYGFDWNAFRAIGGSTQGIVYEGWFSADRDLSIQVGVHIPAGERLTQGGATAPNYYPASLDLYFYPYFGIVRMGVEDEPGPPLPPIPGDFNGDGKVGINDYDCCWVRDYGTANPRSDANADGIVDTMDYVIWRDWLGTNGWPATTLAAPPQSTPEPLALCLAICGIALVAHGGRRSKRRTIASLKLLAETLETVIPNEPLPTDVHCTK